MIGVEATGARLERIRPDGRDATASVLYLRAQLAVLVVNGHHDELHHSIAEARRLAQAACAPALGWIADWAAAARLAPRDPEGAWARARAAATVERPT